MAGWHQWVEVGGRLLQNQCQKQLTEPSGCALEGTVGGQRRLAGSRLRAAQQRRRLPAKARALAQVWIAGTLSLPRHKTSHVPSLTRSSF